MSHTLPAFSKPEFDLAHHLLAARVAYMMGRKFEEGDWSHVYARAKGLPERGWSNLNIDVMHQGLGVEQKMYCYRSGTTIREACGTSIMHPAATRAIRIPDEEDPDKAMKILLQQYGDVIEARREKVKADCPAKKPDMRTGWLLWQESLCEFLYFEEEMRPPDVTLYRAEWVERKQSAKGTRKGSRNLWIYEKSTGRKRYSITTEAGAKIQPYFDVPPLNDPHLYVFVVQGLEFQSGLVRLWLTESTASELERIIGTLDTDRLSDVILACKPKQQNGDRAAHEELVRTVELKRPAYERLRACFEGVSDEHRMQLLVRQLKEARSGGIAKPG